MAPNDVWSPQSRPDRPAPLCERFLALRQSDILSRLYNDFGATSDGILKSIFNEISVASYFFTGSLEVATRHSVLLGNAEGIVWVRLLMVLMATTSYIQDLRDMQGDRTAGRVHVVAGIGCWTVLVCRF